MTSKHFMKTKYGAPICKLKWSLSKQWIELFLWEAVNRCWWQLFFQKNIYFIYWNIFVYHVESNIVLLYLLWNRLLFIDLNKAYNKRANKESLFFISLPLSWIKNQKKTRSESIVLSGASFVLSGFKFAYWFVLFIYLF